MVTDSFGYSMSQIGYYAGWLTSAYFLSQIFSSIILGQLSDIKGRRGIMLMGMAGNFVTTLIFGMSRVFWLALMARLVCGLVNGNIGVLKTYVREITDGTNQARAYTLRSAGWSIGTIIGPLLGGVLARPALQYPSVFSSTGFFAYFPFLLPCIASAAITAVSFTLGCFFLQETLRVSVQPSSEIELEEQLEDEVRNSSEEDLAQDSAVVPLETVSPTASHERVPPAPAYAGSSFSPSIVTEGPLGNSATEETSVARRSSSTQRYDLLRITSALSDFRLFLHQLVSRLEFFKQALQERDVVVCIILYTGVSFIALGFDEVFSFWSVRPVSQGGIGFSTRQIGASHAISGVAMLIMQIIVYVPMDRFLGTQRTLTFSMAMVCPAFLLISFASNVADTKPLLWTLISLVMILKAGFGTTSFAAVNLLVNNAADPATVGAVNGLSASTAAIGRVLAPVVLGSIFAVTSNSSSGFPFDYHFVFICLAVTTAIVSVGSHFGLPESINKRKS